MHNHHRRTALITGASRGLGLALAGGLASAGWRLIIDARGADALEQARAALAAHTEIVAIAGDIADPAHRAALAATAHDLGGIDLLINNAGILGPAPLPALLDYPLDALTELFQVNLVAQLGIIQALREQLQPGAVVINISSDAAIEPYPGWGGYGATKAALDQISAVLAAERPELRIYAVDPGDMRTQMHQAAFPGEDISDRPLPEASIPGLLMLIEGELPAGRYRARELVTSLPVVD